MRILAAAAGDELPTSDTRADHSLEATIAARR